MTARRYSGLASAAVLVFGALCAQSAEARPGAGGLVTLRLRLKQGESYRIQTTIKQKVIQTVLDVKQETNETSVFNSVLAVKHVDAAGVMSGTQHGAIRVDEATGWVVGGALKQSLRGGCEMRHVRFGVQSVTLPLRITTETTYGKGQ